MFKIYHARFICFAPAILFAQSSTTDAPRVKKKINNNWKFILDDHPTYCETGLKDSSWQQVSLPHNWSVEGSFSKSHSGRNAWLPGGIAWYRKNLIHYK